ncbi:hypothetical protein CVT24_012395 [Panaeolus cyanescens]|uniref:TFIIS N-terminal domain-containing protein n=1 Tax=Panaeolus cyanescens TaxID=181874 RepID=A0A409YJB7_9AGAR|nr:hypothetical protein CVT24_012395 [Panaeolus cyanescens]
MRRDLEREVFGGSESELSSAEEEEIQQKQQHKKPPVSSPSRVAGPSGDKDAFESSDGDSEDDYRQEKPASKPKKRTKRPQPDSVEGKAIQKKRKRPQPVPVDINELPPEEAKKARLNIQIEQILRGGKKSNRQRKKKANEEVLDTYADDEVARLREAMNNAADEDIRSNQEKLPATAKLKLLTEAIETLRKANLAQSIIDNNLLEAVRRWLEPLPDRSLPALNIQREFFHLMPKMEFIDSSVLKESGLGRIVLFYTKCKRVHPDISRIANELISVWSRPIIKRPASYRDRVVPVAQDSNEAEIRAGERLSAILARAKEAEKGRVRRNAVMIPQRELGTYTVAPKSSLGLARGQAGVDAEIDRRRKAAERHRAITRKLHAK